MDLVTAWLQQWGTLSVAALALAQPWLFGAYRRFFRKPQIEAFPISTIEVGYSQLGATIGLNGTLLAKGRDVFVYSIELEVIRQKDKATHDFVWALFRGFKAKMSEFDDMEMELASGFILKLNRPRRYNILFQDVELSSEVRDVLEELQTAWIEYSLPRLEAEHDSFDQLTPPTNVFEDFSREEVYSETLGQIDRLRYWEPGRYSLTMRVLTSDPDGSYEFVWEFELTSTQEGLIKLNSSEMIHATCGHGTGNYRFAYADYEA